MAGAKRRSGDFGCNAANHPLLAALPRMWPCLFFVVLGRSRKAACVEGAANQAFVILGRSKERSDAAQTLG
ncbi:MAG: hypothetical protein E5Y50_15230, partial [Mesorhizobium sp.]